MQSQSFNEKEALQLIESSLNVAKNKFNENGFVFRFWGWACILGEVMCYIWIVNKQPQLIGWTWCAVGVLGGIVNVIYFSQREKKINVKTYMDKILQYVWGAIGIGGVIFYAFLIIAGPQWLINPFVMTVIGIGTFITGGVLKFKPLIYGGLVFFAFTIATLFITGPEQFLITGFALIPGYLIPGYMLFSHYKKQENKNVAVL